MPATSPTNGTHHDHAPFTAPPPGPDARPQAPDGGRDAHGRFGKGNPGGPGNPFARQVAALRSGLLARLTPQDLADVAEALLRQAREGNVAAARLLLSYALGKPAPAVDPDTLDLHEFGLYQRLPDPSTEMTAATLRVGLPFALKYLRVVLPRVSDAQERMMAEGIADREEQEQRQADARERRKARRAALRARKKPRAAARATKPAPAHSPAPAPAAGDAHALDVLARLLGMAGLPVPPSQKGGKAGGAPSTNGVNRRPGQAPPPPANG